jgi:hypothetical protein
MLKCVATGGAMVHPDLSPPPHGTAQALFFERIGDLSYERARAGEGDRESRFPHRQQLSGD